MTTESIAEFLINGMPYAVGLKTLVFLVLGITLVMQRTQSRLGKWINALFFATFLASIWMTWLTTYLTRSAEGSDIQTWDEWGIVILANVAPWLVAISGVMVTYYTYRAEPIEIKDDRDRRQEHTQEVLDETSLVLAKRGQKLSNAGIQLDERILQLGEDRRVADQREHDLDVRDEEGKP